MTDEQHADEKSPVEQALDLLVFAPLGLAMTARTQLPDMVAKGRAQVENQITVARFIGQFAVQQGRAEVEKRLKAFTDAGVPPEAAPPAAVPQDDAAGAGRPQAGDPGADGSGDIGDREPGGGDGAPGAKPSSGMSDPLTVLAQPAPEEAAPADAKPAPAAPQTGDLAIHGYDALSASQVVQRLAGLSSAELEQVRAYEAATRGRKTVLTKIAQLQ